MKLSTIIGVVIITIAGGIAGGCGETSSGSARPQTMQELISAAQKERQAAGEPANLNPDNDLWYKNAVIYTLDVEVFKDSDGDGTGDFKGLISQLDYIQSLGVNAIWLSPFQPTPNQDDGYDVSDYYQVDPRLGTMADFKAFMQAAGERKIRVMMDLVVNHTSDQHSWFKQGRAKGSPYHNWYVWSKEKPKNIDVGMVFPGVQESIWTYDSVAGEYYYHRFYKHQPDLNMQNPQVEAEITKVVEHWLDQGIAGFRLDGVPFFIEVPKTEGEKFEHQFEILTRLRHTVQRKRRDAIILGEANVLPKEQEEFFGKNGNAMHMMFNFFANQHLFYALATGKTNTLENALEVTKDIPVQAQWAQFLRNHDEIDLGRLSDKERQEVFDAFGPDSNMQLYDRGIRRRMAPMLHNNRKLIELAYSALFAMPATPVIRYGEEIGMGDNLFLKERESVRTPMQWANEPNGGFSKATKPVKAAIDTGQFGYQYVNVQKELADSGSLLNWIRHMVQLRKSCPGTGWGNWELVKASAPGVLILKNTWQGETLVTIHNFNPEQQQLSFDPSTTGGTLQNLLRKDQLAANEKGTHQLTIEGYGYRWYKVK
jgi:maltose alpha-D-glucosyltransferase / alpha-amylase